MSTVTAVLVGAALLSLWMVFLIRARRIERAVDLAQVSRGTDEDDNLALLARIIANSIVASP